MLIPRVSVMLLSALVVGCSADKTSATPGAQTGTGSGGGGGGVGGQSSSTASSSGGGGSTGNPKPEAIVTVSVTGDCNEAVVAECPNDYVLLGGGIEFPDWNERCEPDFAGEGRPREEVFVHSFSSYPADPAVRQGWSCRVDGRHPSCYAICGHKETLGISGFERPSVYDQGHKDCGNSGCQWQTAVTCPEGTTVIGGGLQSEVVWEIDSTEGLSLEDAEEVKVLGVFIEGNTFRCDLKSQDHWGDCYAMCVKDEELQGLGFRATTLTQSKSAACEKGERIVGGGLSFCPVGDCNDRIDYVQSRPDETSYLCELQIIPPGDDAELGKVPGAGEIKTPLCQAYCMTDK